MISTVGENFKLAEVEALEMGWGLPLPPPATAPAKGGNGLAIGLGVAGGALLLGGIGFLVYKKR